jgi:hypothetical protein
MLFWYAHRVLKRDSNVAFANCYGDLVQNSAMACETLAKAQI